MEKSKSATLTVQKLKVAEGADENGGSGHRPKNLAANVLPHDGFVLAVDGVLKTHFETSGEARTAGLALKKQFPVVHIEIFDATARQYSPLVEAS